MTIASEIIQRKTPNFAHYVAQGESLDDIDEYGFTPLIETAITRQPELTRQLISLGVDVNVTDVTGRTPLLWAIDKGDEEIARLLLEAGAHPNAYVRNGLSALVYPVLRRQQALKHLLYQYGAKLDFALDFILAKLIGHRFELKGSVDIVNADGHFIELNYEGFILEFTVVVIRDALRRFVSSYSTRHLRTYFPKIYTIMDALGVSDELLTIQRQGPLRAEDAEQVAELIKTPLLILPAASRGHALSFIRYKEWWAKIDRGENSLKEGSVNVYRLGRPEAITVSFMQQFLYKKQPRSFFQQEINTFLQLKPVLKIPISAQISGNCSWANVQAVLPVCYALQQLDEQSVGQFSPEEALSIYDAWVEWDKDRAIDECIQRFYGADPKRKASLVSLLMGIVFHTCDASQSRDLLRAEKIMPVLILEEYRYVLQSYLNHYCVKRLTYKGNNLLKLLEDCGINPKIDVTPIATGLLKKKKSS